MHGPDGLIPSLDRTIPKGWKNQNPDEGNVQNKEKNRDLPEGWKMQYSIDNNFSQNQDNMPDSLGVKETPGCSTRM